MGNHEIKYNLDIVETDQDTLSMTDHLFIPFATKIKWK